MPRAKSTGRRLERTKDNRKLCKCGHSKNFHARTLADGTPRECWEEGCKCRKFKESSPSQGKVTE